MKRILLLCFLFILTLSFVAANAQVKLGVQGGVNLTDISIDPKLVFDTGMKTRLILGGIINYNFSPLLSLELEPAYIQKGSSVDITGIEEGINYKGEGNISADYIEVPVLLKLTFDTKQVKPFLLAGLFGAFLLGDVKLTLDKVTAEGQDVTNLLPAEIKEQTQKSKSTDFGLSFGGGLTIPLNKIDIFIEGLYDLGLANINDDPEIDSKFKSRGIQIKAGVLFSL